MSSEPVVARPASTVLVVRPGDNLEVLMVRRPARGFFGGLMVFPGGAIEECDREIESDHPDSEFRVGGLRETAEEVGFVITESGFVSASNRGRDLLDDVESSGEALGLDRMVLVSRWLTPRVAPTRFDTRFYIVALEGDPEIVLDPTEIEEHFWVSPSRALDRHAEGEWSLILPTIAHLRWLSKRRSLDDALAAARGADGLTIIEPMSKDGDLLVRYRGAE